MKIHRRHFLQLSAVFGAMSSVKKVFGQSLDRMVSDLPIRSVLTANSIDFNGDDIHRSHDVLWDIEGYISQHQDQKYPIENREFVIVGGGVSGLLVARNLKDQDFVLLESDPQFGGNSKGEEFQGAFFSTGAAYVTKPSNDSDLMSLLKELNLIDKFREEEVTSVLYHNKFVKNFWRGEAESELSEKKEVLQFETRLKELNGKDELMNEDWDGISFEQWLNQEFPTLPVAVKEYLQLYAWSSFGASLEELSAYQMLGFIAAETDGIWSAPGGNALIAQALVKRLRKLKGDESLRASCIVMRVKTTSQGVEVLYEDADRRLKMIRAKKAIVCCPKFVAKRIVPEIPEDQRKAMDSIRYRGYIVANVILSKKFTCPSYELYQLQGEVPEMPMALRPPSRPMTDLCFGTWAQDQVKMGASTVRTVLTCYKALPMDGARQFLFSPMAHEKQKAQVMKAFPGLLESLSERTGVPLTEKDILGVRMTRWGHSLPLAEVGFLKQNRHKLVSRPIADKIFFVNQDNVVNPCLETALDEALKLKEILS